MAILVLHTIFYSLAVYGFVILLINTVIYFIMGKSTQNSDVRLVLIVKDQEEKIEGIIRSMQLIEAQSNFSGDGKLYIVDAGSSDSTMLILNKLAANSDNIKPISNDKREEIFNF